MGETTIKSPSDQLRDAWQDGPYGSVVLYGADLIDEQVRTIGSLRSELEEARGRIAELEREGDDDESFVYVTPPLERRTIGIVVPEAELAAKDARIAELEAALGKVLHAYTKLPSNLTPPKWLAEVRAAAEGKSDA